MMWVILGVQGALFLVWTVTAYRILFHLVGRARAKTGHVFPGPLLFVQMVGDWMADPSCRAQRWWFCGLTVALLAVSVFWSVIAPYSP